MTRVHGRIELRAGGSAANAALAAARLGARAAVIGRVGADAAGRLVADALAAGGVEPLLAFDADVPTGCVVVVGGTSIVADPGASARLAPDDLPATLEARAVLVSGYSLLQRGPEAAARAALERARTGWLAVDVGSARLVAAFGVDRFLEATATAGVLLANAEEARALTGLDAEDAALALARRYASCASSSAAPARWLRPAKTSYARRCGRSSGKPRSGRATRSPAGSSSPSRRSGPALGAPSRVRRRRGRTGITVSTASAEVPASGGATPGRPCSCSRARTLRARGELVVAEHMLDQRREDGVLHRRELHQSRVQPLELTSRHRVEVDAPNPLLGTRALQPTKKDLRSTGI